MHYLNQLKTLVNTKKQWDAFNDMLDANIVMHQKKLEQAVDPTDLYKAQGAIQALRKLKYLRDEVNGKESK